MKKLLLATCLTAIFASGALGQYSGFLHFSGGGYDTVFHRGVTFQIDSAWQWGYTDIDVYNGLRVVTLNPDGALQDQGEWQIAATFKQAYSTISNCMDKADMEFHYKLIGGNDSVGMVLEMSWDSAKWYNLCDSAEVSHLIEDTPVEVDPDYNYYNMINDSATISLPDGRKAMGATDSWLIFGFGVFPPYTWEGVGALDELHWRATFVNYSTEPVFFAMWDFIAMVLYWCEHLGIGEQEGNLNVKVYPNPVTECSVMELPMDAVYPAQLIVSDPVGRVIHFDANIRQPRISMYNMSLKQGIYMYTIKDAQNKSSIGKFIVQE